MTYKDSDSIFQKLDNRNVNYRFDLEKDIPWSRTSEPGLHFGPKFCAKVGVDFEGLRQHPEAFEFFQWAVGVEVSEVFYILERNLNDFIDDEHAALGPNRSALLLYQEEVKHMALFRRYSDYLRALRPDWAARFDEVFTNFRPDSYARENYPSAAVQHYCFWLPTLVFEEYTIYLYREFLKEDDLLQPVWLAAHGAHAREEKQHVVTDAAHLRALEITPLEKRACVHAFWSSFDETFKEFLGITTAKAMVRKYFPEAAHCVQDVSMTTQPIFEDIVTGNAFKITLEHAPYVRPRSPSEAA